MRWEYKIFGFLVLFVFIVTFLYNYNKIEGYEYFSREINEMLFGISYIVPLNAFCFIMYRQAKYPLEKLVVIPFMWFAFSALMDELFFDSLKPTINEHLIGLIILPIIYYYERFKKIRN